MAHDFQTLWVSICPGEPCEVGAGEGGLPIKPCGQGVLAGWVQKAFSTGLLSILCLTGS